jgi:pimeloyl-ACP methyl ester carboxylesterase
VKITALARCRSRCVILWGEEGGGYLQQLSIPSLWRSRVQLIAGAGHAAHYEAPATFTDLLDQFLADLS